MKNLALILVLGGSFFLSSCKQDEPETYWYSYGTYVESNLSTSGFIVDLDNGKKMIPTEAGGIDPDVSDMDRIIVVYAIVSEIDSTVNAKVTDVIGILTKGVLQLTEENKDSIGDNGVIVMDNDIWLSKNHLNVEYSYYGWGTTHFINLVKPIGNQLDENGNQILEFKHNDNDDIKQYRYNSAVSFDMMSLYEAGMDSINFIFKSMYYDSTEFSWVGTYHFNLEAPTKSAKIGSPNRLERVY